MIQEEEDRIFIQFSPSKDCGKGKGDIGVNIHIELSSLSFSELEECQIIGKCGKRKLGGQTILIPFDDDTASRFKEILLETKEMLNTSATKMVSFAKTDNQKEIQLRFYNPESIDVVLKQLDNLMFWMTMPYAA